MKNTNRIVIFALCIMCAAIIFLTVRNDVRFNEELKEEIRQKTKLDSTARSQTYSLTALLNNVTVQLDSIRYNQKESNEIMKRDIDSIKSSLEHITRTKQQRLNTKK